MSLGDVLDKGFKAALERSPHIYEALKLFAIHADGHELFVIVPTYSGVCVLALWCSQIYAIVHDGPKHHFHNKIFALRT